MNEELIEHTIKVDKYMELKINIPKVMTPMDFKAITMKANKIFNMVEIPMEVTKSNLLIDDPDIDEKIKQNIIRQKAQGYKRLFTPTMDERYKELSKLKYTPMQIAFRWGLEVKQIESRRDYLVRTKRLESDKPMKPKRKKHFEWTPVKVDTLTKMLAKGIKIKEIATYFDATTTIISRKKN